MAKDNVETKKRKSNGPLTKIIQAEEEIVAQSGNDYNPNTISRLADDNSEPDTDGGDISGNNRDASSSNDDDQSNTDGTNDNNQDESMTQALLDEIEHLQKRVASMLGSDSDNKQTASQSDSSSGSGDNARTDNNRDSGKQTDNGALLQGKLQLDEDGDPIDIDLSDIFERLLQMATELKEAAGFADAEDKISRARDRVSSRVMNMIPDERTVNSIKDDIIAPAVGAALPKGASTIGLRMVQKVSTQDLLKYGLPIGAAILAVQLMNKSDYFSSGEAT